ncbi:MAG: hypothetical protein A2Z19_03735 [Deltaproteobacteria bacterium RBG_16_54_18]|nr:MAG: hypothetical protein A2Z19_03735 [Deltaproteobacteria bacterium RBG_16_54_18]
MNELINVLRGSKGLLGFKSTAIAAAYLGAPLACLICVFYGLIRWNEGRRMYMAAVVRWVRGGMQRLLRRRQEGIRKARRQRPVKKGRGRWWGLLS